MVKVAEFRRLTNRVLDIANRDYHACARACELENWKVHAANALLNLELAECKRASADDVAWKAKAVSAMKERIERADGQIQAFRVRDAERVDSSCVISFPVVVH